jgi:NADH:ubiquinone oxidoreductase subunit H
LLYFAEYLNLFTISYLFALLFGIKAILFLFILFWLRASMPRLKWDRFIAPPYSPPLLFTPSSKISPISSIVLNYQIFVMAGG